MGAVGAVLSVMTRMKRRDGWGLEWEAGRKSVRFLGSIRPWIGALFAFALYLALKSQLVDASATSRRSSTSMRWCSLPASASAGRRC